MGEVPKIRGMQDRSLELGRRTGHNFNGEKSRMTPTKEGDIGLPAQVYIRLVESAVTHTLALEGCNGDESNPFYHQQQEALATVRDEVKAFGYMPDLFEDVVGTRIRKLKRDVAQEEELGLVIKEFPGQFEDADRQAELGDVPPNINFGTHAFKKPDAGGFEPKRRGW